MVRQEKMRSALRAINAVFVMARSMAYAQTPHEEIAAVLDQGEYLPCLMLETEDRTEDFEAILRDLAVTFPACGYVWACYTDDADATAPSPS